MYSQSDEESFILSFFEGGYKGGRFLDIGAHNGRTGSNTLRLAELGVRLPTFQDGRRRVAAALGVPNVMPATVVVRPDGSVATTMVRAFATADEIADAIGNAAG